MAQGLLHRAEVGSTLNLANREAVPQRVGRDAFAETGTRGVVLDYLPEPLACELVSPSIEEESRLFLVVEKVKSAVRDVVAKKSHD